MSDKKTTYEVWNFMGSGSPELVSDDPIEIVNWLRARPTNKRNFNVHPQGPRFHWGKMIAHDFIKKHRKAVADDIVRKAFESGEPDGVAQEIIGLVFGR